MENNRIPLEKMKKNMSKYIKLFQLEDIINKKIVNLSGGEKRSSPCRSGYNRAWYNITWWNNRNVG